MATQVKHRRGNSAEISTFTPAVGEIVMDTDTNDLVIGDGAKVGGYNVTTKLQSDSVVDLKTKNYTVGSRVSTTAYYDGWAATINGPVGGAIYNIVTKAEHDIVRGISVVDEVGDHTLVNGNIALLHLSGGRRDSEQFGAADGIVNSLEGGSFLEDYTERVAHNRQEFDIFLKKCCGWDDLYL